MKRHYIVHTESQISNCHHHLEVIELSRLVCKECSKNLAAVSSNVLESLRFKVGHK